MSLFAWLDNLSALQMGAAFAVGFLVAGSLGIFLLRPLARVWIHGRRNADDMVGFTLASFSTLYGILLGLLAVEAYQDFSTIQDAVSKEALSLSTLYRDFDGYPPPLRADLQNGLRDYARVAIDEHWMQRRNGAPPTGDGAHRLRALFDKLLTFKPTDKGEEIIHGESLRELNTVIELRRFRIASAGGGIPPVMWWVVGVGAALHILLIGLFDMEAHVHLILGGAVSLFLGLVIFLIVSLDSPFSGGAPIGPDPIQATLDGVMRPNERQGAGRAE